MYFFFHNITPKNMLYTIKKSFAIHQIQRDEHSIYFEEYGNKNGIPILFLIEGQVADALPGTKNYLIKNCLE